MKILRSKKALSPVVASIILIAVTVAVSIAVAAWMGALTIGFMQGSEQVEIRAIDFSTAGQISVRVKNTGTSAVTIQEMWVNNVDVTAKTAATTSPTTMPKGIAANTEEVFVISSYNWVAGDNYQVKLVTAKGNPFLKNAIPPS